MRRRQRMHVVAFAARGSASVEELAVPRSEAGLLKALAAGAGRHDGRIVGAGLSVGVCIGIGIGVRVCVRVRLPVRVRLRGRRERHAGSVRTDAVAMFRARSARASQRVNGRGVEARRAYARVGWRAASQHERGA